MLHAAMLLTATFHSAWKATMCSSECLALTSVSPPQYSASVYRYFIHHMIHTYTVVELGVLVLTHACSCGQRLCTKVTAPTASNLGITLPGTKAFASSRTHLPHLPTLRFILSSVNNVAVAYCSLQRRHLPWGSATEARGCVV